MNIWGDDKNNCRIIQELRYLDSEVASLAYISRELFSMHGRLCRLIETLYKWDAGQDPGGKTEEQAADYKQALDKSMSPKAKAQIAVDDIYKIFREWGFELKPDAAIVPPVSHIEAETKQEGTAIFA